MLHSCDKCISTLSASNCRIWMRDVACRMFILNINNQFPADIYKNRVFTFSCLYKPNWEPVVKLSKGVEKYATRIVNRFVIPPRRLCKKNLIIWKIPNPISKGDLRRSSDERYVISSFEKLLKTDFYFFYVPKNLCKWQRISTSRWTVFISEFLGIIEAIVRVEIA